MPILKKPSFIWFFFWPKWSPVRRAFKAQLTFLLWCLTFENLSAHSLVHWVISHTSDTILVLSALSLCYLQVLQVPILFWFIGVFNTHLQCILYVSASYFPLSTPLSKSSPSHRFNSDCPIMQISHLRSDRTSHSPHTSLLITEIILLSLPAFP